MKVLFLMTDFGFMRFFHKIVERLELEGHSVQVSPTMPMNADSEIYNVQQCRWDNFFFDPITRFDPDVVIVFNGYHPSIVGAMAVLKRKYKVFHCETGWLPQYNRAYLDTDMGYGGAISSGFFKSPGGINKTDGQEEILRSLRERYSPKPLPPSIPDRFILVPLQLEHDISIHKDSPYFKLMRALVGFVLKNTRGIPIIVRQHPLGLSRIQFNDWNRIPDDSRVQVIYSDESAVSTNDLAAKATMIIGLNSTSLMEALVHYKPILQFANNMIATVDEEMLSRPELLEEYKQRILAGEVEVNRDEYDEKLLYLYANQFNLEDACPDWVYEKIINYNVSPRTAKDLAT